MISRTLRFKLLYIAALSILAAIAVMVYVVTGSVVAMAIMVIVLFIPGRVGGHYLKNLFLSRSLIDAGHFNEAIDVGRAFLSELQRQPWRRHFIYCFFGLYGWNVEAMARNNIGVAFMELGDLKQAEAHFQEAVEKDPDYPIPYFNLGIIAYARQEEALGDRLISTAAAKGYTQGAVDRVIARVGAAYARYQAKT